MSKREQALVWIAAALVIWAVGSRVVWDPAYARVKAARMDLEAAQMELGQREAVWEERGSAQEEYREGLSYLEEHRDHFWPPMGEEEIQERIIDALDGSGIQVERMKISEKEDEKRGESGEGRTGEVLEDGQARCYRVEFTALAGLESLSAFLDSQGMGYSAAVTRFVWDLGDVEETGRFRIQVWMDVWMLPGVG